MRRILLVLTATAMMVGAYALPAFAQTTNGQDYGQACGGTLASPLTCNQNQGQQPTTTNQPFTNTTHRPVQKQPPNQLQQPPAQDQQQSAPIPTPTLIQTPVITEQDYGQACGGTPASPLTCNQLQQLLPNKPPVATLQPLTIPPQQPVIEPQPVVTTPSQQPAIEPQPLTTIPLQPVTLSQPLVNTTPVSNGQDYGQACGGTPASPLACNQPQQPQENLQAPPTSIGSNPLNQALPQNSINIPTAPLKTVEFPGLHVNSALPIASDLGSCAFAFKSTDLGGLGQCATTFGLRDFNIKIPPKVALALDGLGCGIGVATLNAAGVVFSCTNYAVDVVQQPTTGLQASQPRVKLKLPANSGPIILQGP